MFRNYVKIAFRNLWKHKGYALINIGGLTIGLTGFILLLLYVNYQYSYDQWSPQLKNVYQVNEINGFMSSDAKGTWNDQCDSRIGPALRNRLPDAKAVTMVDIPPDSWAMAVQVGKKNFLQYGMRDSDSSFFKVFPYQFVAGNADHALDQIHTMVITAPLANKWFGSVDVVGRTVQLKLWLRDPGTVYQITGVVRKSDLPSSMDFNAIFRSGENDRGLSNPQSTHFTGIFVRMGHDQNMATLAGQADKIYDASLGHLLQLKHSSLAEYTKSDRRYGIRLRSLLSAHLHPLGEKSVIDRVAPAILLSILLLFIAIINFANLATAEAVQRGKEIGVRKVMGAGKRTLIFQFLLEVAMQCLAAFLISLLLVELFLPFFNRLFDVSLSLWAYHHTMGVIWWQLLVTLLVAILLSGCYPAFFLSGYDPTKVLKGNFSRSSRGVRVRNTLIVAQFLIAAVFITGIGVIRQQVNYMVHADLGFQPSGLINLRSGYSKPLMTRLKAVPGVEYVGINSQLMGNSMNFLNHVKYEGETREVNVATISMETFEAMDVKTLQGRSFSSRYGQDTLNSVVLNQSAAKLLGGDVVGKSLYENDSLKKNIVGVIADYHYEGFDKKVLPTVYALIHSRGPSATMNNLLIRVDIKRYEAAIAGIKKAWESLYPGFPVHYTFLDDSFQQLVAADIRFRKIVSAFTVLSLILSLIGIFALSAFLTTRRTREIGIRRVLGASLQDILSLLNKNFLLLVLLANVIAWPVAYVLISHWLNHFAYRIGISVLPFIVTAAISVLLTVSTVSLQAWKAATAKPAEALKYE